MAGPSLGTPSPETGPAIVAVTSQSSSDAAEAAVVETFGYKQEFARVVGGFASFALSFSNASVTTGTFLAIAGIFAIAGGAGVWVFLVNAVLMLFVGLVYATLSARIPLAGLEYQWGTRLTNAWVGSLLGWLAFGVVTVSTVAVDYVLAATVLPALFAYESSSALTVIVTAIVLVLQGALLALSTRLTTALNSWVVVSEVVLVVGLVVLLVVVGAIRGMWLPHNLVSEGAATGPGYFSLGGLSTVGAFWLLISISFFSISDGFQGCANVAEETKDAQRVVPRAMMQTLIYTAGIQMLLMIALILVSHNTVALSSSPTAMADIVTAVLGVVVTKLFLVVAVFNVFACGLVVFLQMTRYTWAMARDNRFPAARYFRDVHPRFDTPLRVTLLCFVLLIVVLLFFGFNGASFNNLIAAGGLCAIVVYLFVMVIYAFAGRRIPLPEGRFSLGRWEWPVVTIAILWLLFALAIFRAGFTSAWEYFGGMVVLGIVYVVYAVGIRKSEAEPGTVEAVSPAGRG
jgi:amino acid transporter